MKAGAGLDRLFGWTPLAELKRQQKRHRPLQHPGIVGDIGGQLYRFLEPRVPEPLREHFRSGKAVVGEVGLTIPSARAEQAFDGYVVAVYSGLHKFNHAVSRALYSRARIFSESGTIIEDPEAIIEQAVAAVESIYLTFRNSGQIAEPLSYPVSPSQEGIAAALSSHAEAFTLAHEIGHIGIWESELGAPVESTPEFELKADKAALEMVLQRQTGISRRMAYAGAEFGVRIMAGLRHVGYEPGDRTHPLPANRLATIREEARRLCGTRRDYVRLATIASSHDQMLEEIERRLAGPGSAGLVVGMSPDRLLSNLLAIIEECRKGSITDQHALDDILDVLGSASMPDAEKAANEAADLFLAEGSADDPAVAENEAAAFDRIVKQLPEPWRKIFTRPIEAIRHR